MEDAIFNAMTGAIFDRLMSEFSTKVIIFMSATIGEFIDIFDITRKKRIPYHPYQNIFNNFYSEDIRYYFNLYRETHYYPFIFQKDDEILQKISKTPDQEKWLIFVSSKKQGESLEKNIKAKTHKSVIFLNASKKKTDDWNRIIDNSFYEEDILISTKVLDNGVNIIDPSIKHIVLPFCYRIDFLQMLGRLRCSENGRINVYIKQPTIQTLNIHTLQLLKLNDAILDFEEFTKSNKAMTQQLQRLWAISDRRVNNLFYVDNNRNLIVNTMAYLKINLLIFFYSGLLNNYKNSNYYLNIVKSWLGQSSKSVFAPIGLPNCTSFEDFIKLYLNKPISKEDIEDLYNGFQQLYKIHCAELFVSDSNKLNEALGIRKGRDRRISTMNNELKFLNFPYKITKKQGCLALRRFAE